MTRMCLSPAATTCVKFVLILIECLIGLFNLISSPIRMINAKFYVFIVAAFSAFYAYMFHDNLMVYMYAYIIAVIGFAISVYGMKVLYKILNKNIGPKIALMVNSPFGIRLNRHYGPTTVFVD